MRRSRAEVQATLFEGDLDEATWERLEEALIYADVGAQDHRRRSSSELEREAEEGALVGGEALSNRLAELLAKRARTGDDTIDLRPDPTVILVVGVNGTGKTTTIGKLACHLRDTLGRKVVDRRRRTRSARRPTSSSRVWGERAGRRRRRGSDAAAIPAAVAFDAIAPRRASAAPTWSSSTPPAACTRRRT